MPAHQENPSYTSAVLSGPISGMLDLDWRQVLAQACIAAADSHDRRFLVSAGEYLRLWDAMMDLSGQSDVSRLLGLRMAGGPAIPVLFAMTTPGFRDRRKPHCGVQKPVRPHAVRPDADPDGVPRGGRPGRVLR